MSNFALSDLLDAMDSQLNIEKSAAEGQSNKAPEATEVITKMATKAGAEDLTKSASAAGTEPSPSEAGAALFQEIMKTASLNLEVGVNKQASVAGLALAQALMKKAGQGDVTTADGVAPGSTPTKAIVDNAAMNGEGDSYIKPTPTGNGVENSGSVNEIFDSIVADAQSQGAASTDQVHTQGVAAQEGKVEDSATPNQVKVAALAELMEQGFDFEEASEMIKQASEQQTTEQEQIKMEKIAAIQELVANGIEFADAVAMVKQAEAEIAYEMEKSAALAELMDEGIDFNTAAELIKQASQGDVITPDGVALGSVPTKSIVDNAAMNAEGDSYIKPTPTGNGIENAGTVNEIFDALVQDTLAQGAASTDQVNSTGVAAQEGAVEDSATPSQVKVAYMAGLMDAGVDFEDAVEMVKEAGVDFNYWKEVPAKVKRGATGIADALQHNVGALRGNAGPMNAATRKAAIGNIARNGITRAGLAGAALAAGAGIYAATREKKAAEQVMGLVSQGVDFADAVALVKEAGATQLLTTNLRGQVAGRVVNTVDKVKKAMPGIIGKTKDALSDAAKATRFNATMAGKDAKTVLTNPDGRGIAARRLVRNPVAQGAAGAAALVAGAGTYAATREKKAAEAVGMLVERGIAFEDAVSAVSQKASELYGE